MPVTLDKLRGPTAFGEEHQTEMLYLGEVLHITWRPRLITPKALATLATATELTETDAYAAVLSEWLVSWDFLTEEDGPPFATTYDSLRTLPAGFLSDVCFHLRDSAGPKAPSGQPSNGSS